MHDRSHTFDVAWPEPPLHVVVVEPEIPPNTGNIARLAAATGSVLHLVEPLGFRLTDRALKRAGLDYWERVRMVRHPNFQHFLENTDIRSLYLYSTAGQQHYASAAYQPGDALIFGSESRGLPSDILQTYHDRIYGIPMQTDNVRSLNLATSVAVVLYEALRQLHIRQIAGSEST